MTPPKTTPPTLPRRFVRALEVCEYLSISRRTLTELVRDSGFPHVRFNVKGKRATIRFELTAVDRWVKERTHEGC